MGRLSPYGPSKINPNRMFRIGPYGQQQKEEHIETTYGSIGNLTNDATEEEILAFLGLDGATYLCENSLARRQWEICCVYTGANA